MTCWTPELAVPEEVKRLLQQETSSEGLAVVFFRILSLLKKQKRTGWLDYGLDQCESISDHMYRMGVISTVLPEYVTNILLPGKERVRLDKARCAQIALVHDMAESLVGDITPRDTTVDKQEKHRRELATIDYLTEHLVKPYNPTAAEEIKTLWLEYENVSTIEARYVKDIDKFEMMLQAFEYEQEHPGKNFDSFFDAVPSVKTEEIKKLTENVLAQRKRFWASK